jgi:UDP-3-O-[3-hydroxymyristoyl] glucosamine N-acyltransferase
MINLSELVEYFRKKNLPVENYDGNMEVQITGGKNIAEAGKGEISFVGQKLKATAQDVVNNSNASVILIDKSIYGSIGKKGSNAVFVVCENPKEEMVACLTEFFVEKPLPGIHSSAIIDATARVGANAVIGPYNVIEADVTIGDNCIIESFVTIKKGTVIGNNVKIKSGTVIGGQGFGYIQKNKKWENFPHFGNVVIEDNVEIGSNTCIDRGALGSTHIKAGVKIDNLVHIAHNVVVGENSLIIADAMVGGSTSIGGNTWVAPSTALRNGISIGSNCTIGMGAVVTKSVDDGVTVVGNPGKPFVRDKQ